MGLFPSILYTISLQMAYCGISEKYQCDKNPDSHEKKKFVKKSPPKQGRPKSGTKWAFALFGQIN